MNNEQVRNYLNNNKEAHEFFKTSDTVDNLANDFQDICGYNEDDSKEAALNVFLEEQG